ncbi:chemotaxis protein CheW [bacterium SCSIO 12827]|nr:chemotaxis protein CheW [bacterium SCSIO 12827]
MTNETMTKVDWQAAKKRVARAQELIDGSLEKSIQQSALILKSRARALAERGVSKQAVHSATRMLIFFLSGTRYAIELEALVKVDAWQKPSRIPDSNPALLGVLSQRGIIWGLYDLAQIIAAELPVADPGGSILFMRDMPRHAAFRVDDIQGIGTFDMSAMKPGPGDAFGSSEVIAGVLASEVFALDVDRLRAHQVFSERFRT